MRRRCYEGLKRCQMLQREALVVLSRVSTARTLGQVAKPGPNACEGKIPGLGKGVWRGLCRCEDDIPELKTHWVSGTLLTHCYLSSTSLRTDASQPSTT